MKPRKQAGYMTAPDQIAITSKIFLATQGPSIHDSYCKLSSSARMAAGTVIAIRRFETRRDSLPQKPI
jgi:hypothetical protein